MSLSPKKINLLREFCECFCEECHRPEEEVGKLEPHRIRKGRDGGEYTLRNIKMVCKNCHNKYESADRISTGVQG